MSFRYFLDLPDSNFFLEVISKAKHQGAMLVPGDRTVSEALRLASAIGAEEAVTKEGSIHLERLIPERVLSGLRKYLTDIQTDYPAASIELAREERIFVIDWEDREIYIETGFLCELADLGKYSPADLRTTQVELFYMFEESMRFSDSVNESDSASEVDALIKNALQDVSGARSADQLAATICIAALILDTHGGVIGQLVAGRLNHWRVEIADNRLWQQLAERALQEAVNYDLHQLDGKVEHRLKEVLVGCLSLHSAPDQAATTYTIR